MAGLCVIFYPLLVFSSIMETNGVIDSSNIISSSSQKNNQLKTADGDKAFETLKTPNDLEQSSKTQTNLEVPELVRKEEENKDTPVVFTGDEIPEQEFTKTIKLYPVAQITTKFADEAPEDNMKNQALTIDEIAQSQLIMNGGVITGRYPLNILKEKDQTLDCEETFYCANFVSHQTTLFVARSPTNDYEKAKNFCPTFGGKLISIRNQYEYDYLYKIIQDFEDVFSISMFWYPKESDYDAGQSLDPSACYQINAGESPDQFMLPVSCISEEAFVLCESPLVARPNPELWELEFPFAKLIHD